MMLISTSVPLPDRSGLALRRRQRVRRHLVRRLGHAVGLEHRRAERRFERVHHRGGSDALHDRMKRSFSVPAGRRDGSVGSPARASSSWCSVGTAEYQVTP